ncbi:hypothetical protein Acsp04_66910 [Actinomadura sp. NBRC 104425]|uniref:DUF397 domain-containing protein n=1 Tax=Actinomadura sp. NBRC 104425 TaxID=3032204 RepID=UPI0024A53A14|nr:DUF397 domain-containing protein [Actinomadura sp. NBRC 104425]GLZ16456.1 hypothetical protein Acsp04_66910 [Actinomadura sp. NBRC 104425]
MTPVWRKSSHSGTDLEKSDCVEIAQLGEIIAVRDSKNPNGPRVEFNSDDWRAFTHRIRNGHHDLT